MKRLLTLLLGLVVVGGAIWWFRDSLPLPGGGTVATEVSPEAAEDAEEKLLSLRSGGEEIRLNSAELSSLLIYRRPEWAPEAVRSPLIRMEGDTLRMAATIPTAGIPSHPDLDRIRGLLPDSARLEVAGRVRTLHGGRAALDVRAVELAGIPVPERYYPPMLERFGRSGTTGLRPTELDLPLPPGVSEVRVENGFLVLIP